MACFSPLRAVITGVNENGKKQIKILKGSDTSLYPDGFEYISLPCGHCIGCRLKYSRIWADRCLVESYYHDSNYFITLTYNDDFIPAPLPLADGSLSPIHPLIKRDVQLFIKRLRKMFPEQNIRYFLCGEYGNKTMRPHYHLILFGLFLEDLKPLYMNQDGFSYYTSESIDKIWCSEEEAKKPKSDRRSFGYHIIADVNWNTCAYVARYIVKKQYGDGAEIYNELNYPKEFTLMSRKPGIGRQFYEDHKLDLYSDIDGLYLSTPDGARRIRANRYYDRLYDIEYPDHFSAISNDRMVSALTSDFIKSSLTDLSDSDMLNSEEITVSAKIKSLKRGDL